MIVMSSTTAILIVGALALSCHSVPDSYFLRISPNGTVREERTAVVNDHVVHYVNNIRVSTLPTQSSLTIVNGNVRPMTPEEKKVFDKAMENLDKQMDSLDKTLNGMDSSSESTEDESDHHGNYSTFKNRMKTFRNDMQEFGRQMRSKGSELKNKILNNISETISN